MASLPTQSPPPKSSTISFTGRDPHCWSKLPLDLMLMVFEILSFADFERAKSVCSSWYSGSKQSKPNNKIPWMILFPEDKNYCLLTNPEDKEKLYKTQHLGDGFAKSVCLTTCRSWLLMHADYRDMEGNINIFNEKHNLFILNLLTHERINILPAFKSYYHRLGCPILWIDEKTKDYLVIGKAGPGILVSFKKGDNSWKRTKLPFSRVLDSLNLVYKDHKLYCLNYEKLHIFDFSGEIPLQVTIPGGLYITRPDCPWQLLLKMYRRKGDMVVTVRGDVLFVWRIRVCKTWAFKIFKMGSSKGTKWEKIISLGDESIILDLGITVLAKDVEGMTSNSIYFNANDLVDEYDENELFIFNIDTRKVERSLQFHFKKKDKSLQFDSSPVTISYSRWLLPSFKWE